MTHSLDKNYGISFDLWDTIIVDDSDEPIRKSLGLPTKAEARVLALIQAIRAAGFSIPEKTIRTAWEITQKTFEAVWHGLYLTWSVSERIAFCLQNLNLTLPKEIRDNLVRTLEIMELEVQPLGVENIREVLDILSQKYRLAVISDTVFSPGWVLEAWLRAHGLRKYFDLLVFSDQVRMSKPNPEIFRKASAALNIDIDHWVHIGDREHNDVQGPHRAGARAILTTVVKDRGSQHSMADAICRDYVDLPALIHSVFDSHDA